MTVEPAREWSIEEREQRLDLEIGRAAGTGVVTSRQAGQATATLEYRSARPNHVLHAILTFFTCFAWGIVWLVISLSQTKTYQHIRVDEHGRVWFRRGNEVDWKWSGY